MNSLAQLNSVIAPAELALVWCVVIFAALMRAFTGFGFALAAVPVFSLIMQPSEAVVLSASLTLAVSLLTLRTYWGRYPLRAMRPMLVAALAGTVFGAALLSAISRQQFQLAIGGSVIVASFALTLFRSQRQVAAATLTRSWLAVLAGSVSGVLNGAFAIPGPPVIIYAIATESDPRRSRSLLLTFFLWSAVIALASYASAGFINARSMLLFALALPAMLLGDRMGYRLFSRFGGTFYRRVAVLLLFVIGVTITGRALSSAAGWVVCGFFTPVLADQGEIAGAIHWRTK